MSFKVLASCLAALALLGACATATPYQASDNGRNGFTQQQIENNRWSVTFSGNSLTERQTVETYLLYRAAELTKQEGFDHFRFVQRETEGKSRLVATGYSDPFYSNFYCDYRFYGYRGAYLPSRYSARGRFASHYGGYYDPFYGWGGYDYREITRYDATAEIVMGRGEKPDTPDYFSAEQVLVNLAGKIERPEATG